MSADNFKRIDLDYLYPQFRDRLLEVIGRLNDRGIRYVATRGYASFVEQMSLWCQGRMKPGAIVTHAKGGQSQHNYGIAVDFVRDVDPSTQAVEPGWSDKDFQPLIDELKLAGLHSGVPYKDRPHAGLDGFVNWKQLEPLMQLYSHATVPAFKLNDGKDAQRAVLARLATVWQHLDKVVTLPAY